MMKFTLKIVLLFILVNHCLDGRTQFYSTDSLLQLLDKQEDEQGKAEVLKTLGESYFLINNDTAIYYFTKSDYKFRSQLTISNYN